MSDLVELFGDFSAENSSYINTSQHDENVPLPPEPQSGNVEYKLMLENPTKNRLKHLTTQLNWRLKEGNGQAIYEIGVADDGTLVGLSRSQMQKSLSTLRLMADELSANVKVIRERRISCALEEQLLACQVLVRQNKSDHLQDELRVALLGNTLVGKSTLISVLANGELDNGLGSSRLNLFRHRHEIQSGRTSSISREVLGFDIDGNAINYSGNQNFLDTENASFQSRTPEEIVNLASKLVTLIDLAGYSKYFRTTVFGLIGNLPHHVLLLVNAVSGLCETTKEHLSLISALDLSFSVVINKIDLVQQSQVEQLIDQVHLMISEQSSDKELIWVKSPDQLLLNTKDVVFVIASSCTTGEGLQLLYSLLFNQSQTLQSGNGELSRTMPKFYVDEIFHHNVVGGVLVSGLIQEHDELLIGPDSNGLFQRTQVISLHKHKASKTQLCAGQSGTIALDGIQLTLRKGMVLVGTGGDSIRNHVCLCFKASLKNVSLRSGLAKGFQATIYINHIRQNVVITKILGKRNRIATNERALVIIRFIKQPEYICAGDSFLLKEGPNKATGKILKLYPLKLKSCELE